MNDVVISVQELSKCYQVFDDQRHRLLHHLWPGSRRGVQEIWALGGVSFTIRRGEAVALIGRNGGGKSTLLEILTGTLTATSGSVEVKGRVSALLELGSGFDPELSGRDNVVLNGLLLGLKRSDIQARFGDIEEFAEIGVAIDRPVKTYSSGMLMRLAFAVQVIVEPEILIVDEALSVGDFFFQQKCLGYIRKLCANGTTLLFVSHDLGTVRGLCSRAIYLKAGKVEADGASTEVIHRFLTGRNNDEEIASGEGASDQPAPPIKFEADRFFRDALWRAESPRVGASLLAVTVLDSYGNPCTAFDVGDTARLVIAFRVDADLFPEVSVALVNKYDQTVSVTGSYHLGCAPDGTVSAGNVMLFQLDVVLNVEAGQYGLDVNLGKVVAPNQGFAVDRTPRIGPITVRWDYAMTRAPFLGMFGLPTTGKYSRMES